MTFNLDEHMQNLNEDQVEKIKTIQRTQRELGMTPRNDSILTYNFALGNVPDFMNDSNVIAQELVIVNHIHTTTNYSQIIESVMREIAQHVHFKYKLDWNTTWDIVKFYVPDMLKLYCVRTQNITFPI